MWGRDSRWALNEALLLCADKGQCPSNVNTSINTGVHTSALSSQVRTVSHSLTEASATLHCSLEVFTTFITTPQNLQYYDDSVLINRTVEEKNGVLCSHTVYRGTPPVDVLTEQQYITLYLPDACDTCEALQCFVKHNVYKHGEIPHHNSSQSACRSGHDGITAASTDISHKDEKNSNTTDVLLPSKIFVYTIHSIEKNTIPPSTDHMRGWIHLSAYVAYETPGPCVELMYVMAADNNVITASARSDAKIARIRNLCELLQKMMSRGMRVREEKQTQRGEGMRDEDKEEQPPHCHHGSYMTGSSPELREHSFYVKFNMRIPNHVTHAQRSVLQPLLTLHTTAVWRLLQSQQDGCRVEICEARMYMRAPPFLYAYRIFTTIRCGLQTFLSLVTDPAQTHRYDALTDTVTVMETSTTRRRRNTTTTRGGEGKIEIEIGEADVPVMYGRSRRLAAYAAQRDYCVRVGRALLQPMEAQNEGLLPLKKTGKEAIEEDVAAVYLQDATQSDFHPPCDGYERQYVYAFGYIVIVNAADTHLQVYHIACIDSRDMSEPRLEVALMQEHTTRLAWIRQICEDLEDSTAAGPTSPAVTPLASSIITNTHNAALPSTATRTTTTATVTTQESSLTNAPFSPYYVKKNSNLALEFTEIPTIEDSVSFMNLQDMEIHSDDFYDDVCGTSFEELEGIFDHPFFGSITSPHADGVDAAAVPFRRASPLPLQHIATSPMTIELHAVNRPTKTTNSTTVAHSPAQLVAKGKRTTPTTATIPIASVPSDPTPISLASVSSVASSLPAAPVPTARKGETSFVPIATDSLDVGEVEPHPVKREISVDVRKPKDTVVPPRHVDTISLSTDASDFLYVDVLACRDMLTKRASVRHQRHSVGKKKDNDNNGQDQPELQQEEEEEEGEGEGGEPRKICIYIRTLTASARTELVPFTDNPVFHNARLCLYGPQGHAMTITAVLQTHTGHLKRLGTAVVSLQLLQSTEPRTRWISLVRRPGSPEARIRGSVCITLQGGGCNVWPSMCDVDDKEETLLRQRVLSFLSSSARRELHRLEWIVGYCCCSCLTPEAVDTFLARCKRHNQKGSRKSTSRSYSKSRPVSTISLTIVDVRALMLISTGVPLRSSPACCVVVDTKNITYRTRIVPLHEAAVFNESCELHVTPDTVIHISVFAAAVKVGELCVAAALQDGIRSHTLVGAAGTKEASPCGSITLAIRSVSSSGSRRPVQNDISTEKNGRTELRLLLWKYSREVLHKLDVIMASSHSLHHYYKMFGKKIQRCDLRVSIKRWNASDTTWDSPSIADTSSGVSVSVESINTYLLPFRRALIKRSGVYAFLHVGLHHCSTNVVRTSDIGTAQFDDPVIFRGVLPERDEVLLAFMGKSFAGSDDIDLGVVSLSLRTLLEQRPAVLTVPLVRHAGSKNAYFKGSARVELLALNFGATDSVHGVSSTVCPNDNNHDSDNSNTKSIGVRTVTASCRSCVQRMLYRYAPQQLHRVECLLAEHAGHGVELIQQLQQQYGPDLLSSPMQLRLIGIRNFTSACSCYVKVYMNGETILRTSTQPASSDIKFALDDEKNNATVRLTDPQHMRLRFKLAQHRYLQSTMLSFAEISLRSMVAGMVNTCWVPLFEINDDEGNHNSKFGGAVIGYLGVALSSDGFVHREVELDPWEDVERDVISLLRRYRPEALPFLHPLITEMRSVASAHAELRGRILARPIAATLYISIANLSLTDFSERKHWQEGRWDRDEFTVTATCGHEDGSVVFTGPFVKGTDNVIRLDIPSVKEDTQLRQLIITVRQLRHTGPLSRSGRKSSSSVQRRSRSASPRTPQPLPLIEVGRVVVSIRALLTPLLYDKNERITLPLISFMQGPSSRMTLQQQYVHQQQRMAGECVSSLNDNVGSITFSVDLPSFEEIPSWLQFDPAKVEKHTSVDRGYIRYYENSIRDIMAKYEPRSLLEFHYTMYERDVRQGQWKHSLRDWKRLLMRRFGDVRMSLDSPRSPPAREQQEQEKKVGDASGLEGRSDNHSHYHHKDKDYMRLNNVSKFRRSMKAVPHDVLELNENDHHDEPNDIPIAQKHPGVCRTLSF